MEIKLIGSDRYKIPNWNGSIEIGKLKLFQMQRIAGIQDKAILFKKLIKIFKGKMSPVELPEGLEPENLDLADFIQILIGLQSYNKGRQMQKTFTCPGCESLNPRVIDLIGVCKPTEPKSDEYNITIGIDDKPSWVARYVTVKDFIENNDYVNKLDSTIAEEHYGDLYDLSEKEDFDDLTQLIAINGILARVLIMPGIATFEEKMKALSMQDDPETIKDVSKQVMDLSPTMTNRYSTKCTHCKQEMFYDIEETDYFFDSL